MSKATKLYSRLTRNAPGLGTYTSLWLASDHIMLVRSTGYNESYSRVQLSDLKGVFLTDSDRRLWWGIVWGALAVLCGVFLVRALMSGGMPLVSGFFLLLFCTAIGWNHALGPGCRAYFVTGVQTARVPSLVRRKKAIQVIERLEPLITAAQAHLVLPDAVPSETATRGQDSPSTAISTPPSVE